MWFRAATPLTLCFLVAFVFCLLSVLSTPIIKGIPIANYRGYNFGVFGYCNGAQCSGFTVGYNTDELFPKQNTDFQIPSGTRTSLSSILIVHPVAALLSLICTSLAFATHFHGPSHSPRFLLALLLMTIPTLLVSLLAFLVDILLFIPHLSWGGWIVLAATIVNLIGIIMTCAMRRTLVSRRARKQRINENADMNGDNFYAQRTEPAPEPAPGAFNSSLPRAESPPPLSTGQTLVGSSSDKGPDFATFDYNKKLSDDRQPLNPTRSNSDRDDSSGRYYGDNGAPPGQGPNMGRAQPRDQYGNPILAGGYGQPLRHQNSNGTVGSQGSRGPPPGFYRGRGGPPRGGPRGGFGPPRGGYRGGPQGMRGPPPPGWNGGRGGMGPPGPGPMMGRGQRGPPPVYEIDPYYSSTAPQAREPSPYGQRDASPPRNYAELEGPIGQAIEMDAVNGVVPPRSPDHPNYGLRDSDGDVQGMVGLQQQRTANGPSPLGGHNAVASPTSEYSSRQSEFVPARTAWNAPPPQQTPQPFHNDSNDSRGLSPIQGSPIAASPPSPAHGRKQSTDYYEDVDPRFAGEQAPISPPITTGVPSSAVLPGSLAIGNFGPSAPQQPAPHSRDGPGLAPIQSHLDPNSSYEELADGARSPAHSDTSHFTSISQRPVNPDWHPPPGEYPGPYGAQQRGPQQRDVLLETNPDFGLPGVGPPGRGRGGMRGGMVRGRGGPAGLTGPGRYPGPEAL